MTGTELRTIRDLLNVGSVEFIENYLGAKYHTGKKWLSGEIDVPGPAEKCALLWKFIHDKKLTDSAIKKLTGENHDSK